MNYLTYVALKKAKSIPTSGGGGDAVIDSQTPQNGKISVDVDNYIIAKTPSGKQIYLNTLTFNGPPNGDINGEYFGQLLVEFNPTETSIVNIWVYANRTPYMDTGWLPLIQS